MRCGLCANDSAKGICIQGVFFCQDCGEEILHGPGSAVMNHTSGVDPIDCVCKTCPNSAANGGSGVCNCTLNIPILT